MKKLHLFMFLVLACLAVCGQNADAGVQYGPHDFTPINGGSQFKGDNDQPCIYCHTPHGAIVTDGSALGATALPLWNRSLTSDGFTMYDSDTMDAAPATKPRGYSLLCLSCHDGVSVLGAVINNSISGDIYFPDDKNQIQDIGNYPPYKNINIGMDLSNDHPVSIIYGTDTALAAVATVNATALKLVQIGTDYLVECTTCHDPHDYGNGNDPPTIPFLRMSNADSSMCVTCHSTK